MTQEKQDKFSPKEPNEYSKFGKDVYQNAKKFNQRIAIIAPSILLILSKMNEQSTGVVGMSVGALSFFANRYFRRKGDNSAYTYMGQLVGGIQFTTGFLLLTANGLEIYAESEDAGPLLNVLKFSKTALTATQGTLMLMNSYLYGDDTPEPESAKRPA